MSAGEALAGQIASHRPALLRTALARVRDRDLAEDAVQEALVAALACADRFDGRSQLRTWLTGILIHKLGDALRRAARDGVRRGASPPGDPEDDAYAALESHDPSADPERQLENKRSLAVLSATLDRLPARQAAAFVLREVHGLESPTICGRLGVTATNLWVLHHRARTSLREALALAGYAAPQGGFNTP